MDVDIPVRNDRVSGRYGTQLTTTGQPFLAVQRRPLAVRQGHLLEPDTLIARLAALIPRPFKKLVTYHGVFAPAAGYREHVVPGAAEPEPEPAEQSKAVEPAPSAEKVLPAKPRKRRKHYAWAELLRRVFLIDVLLCPCGGRRKLLAAVTERAAIVAILAHLGLGMQAPRIAPARAPPRREVVVE